MIDGCTCGVVEEYWWQRRETPAMEEEKRSNWKLKELKESRNIRDIFILPMCQ